ncbi:MAG: hypothetical protein PVJ02_03600, partial [Gemmatimonadota bacterium]
MKPVDADGARWARVQELFHAALALPVEERQAYLRRACAGDPDLEDEVLALMEEDRRSGSLLDREVDEL